MENHTLIILILLIFLTAQIIITVWNYKSFKYLKRNGHSEKELNDSKYQELKAKHQFTMAIITIIATILGFLGYSTLNNIKDNFQKQLTNQLDSTNRKLIEADEIAKQKFSDINSVINEYTNTIEKLKSNSEEIDNRTKKVSLFSNQINSKLSEMNSSVLNYSSEIGKIEGRIDSLKRKNILVNDIYIVAFKYNMEKNATNPEVYGFSSLRTIAGERLPVFSKKPLILSAIASNGTAGIIGILTNEIFQISFPPTLNDLNDFKNGSFRKQLDVYMMISIIK